MFRRDSSRLQEDVASRSSLNYDVDIVHPAEIHDSLRERAPLKYWRQIKDDVETIVLKWSSFSYDPESESSLLTLTLALTSLIFRLLRHLLRLSLLSIGCE